MEVENISIEDPSIFSLEDSDVKDAISRIKKGYQNYYGPAKTNSIGCFLAQKTPNKGKDSGWIKCKVGGRKTEYYIHHLSLLTSDRGNELKGVKDGQQVSHLCHERTCFNPDHLTVEDAVKNRARNKCISWTWITCPCGCGHEFNPCPHSPSCILPRQK